MDIKKDVNKDVIKVTGHELLEVAAEIWSGGSRPLAPNDPSSEQVSEENTPEISITRAIEGAVSDESIG